MYIYFDFICIFFLQRTASLYIYIIIRLIIVYIYPRCNRYCLYGDGTLFPCLNIIIRNFERGFVFIRWLISGQDFISHSMIITSSSGVFTNDVFIYSHMFKMTYIPPTRYVIYGEYHDLPENDLVWNFYLVPWYVGCSEEAVAARTLIHGSASSTYVSCILYVRMRFPSNLCILSMMTFTCGLPRESGLVLVSY